MSRPKQLALTWDDIEQRILRRAQGCCEWCGRPHGIMVESVAVSRLTTYWRVLNGEQWYHGGTQGGDSVEDDGKFKTVGIAGDEVWRYYPENGEQAKITRARVQLRICMSDNALVALCQHCMNIPRAYIPKSRSLAYLQMPLPIVGDGMRARVLNLDGAPRKERKR
jgi:hypothetical protein